MGLDTVTHAYETRWGTMQKSRRSACGKNDNQSLRNGSYRKGFAIEAIKFTNIFRWLVRIMRGIFMPKVQFGKCTVNSGTKFFVDPSTTRENPILISTCSILKVFEQC